jgi:hypothetical protein
VATCDLLFFLNNQVEISLIKKYAILNQAGNIYECIFLPSYTKWHQERELAKKSAWYSFDQIMYLKNTATLSFIEDYPLEDNQHNNGLLTFHAVMLRTDPQVVLMQYKECVKTLHDDTKSVLLSKQKQPDSYNQKTGILVRNRVKTTFNPTQLRGLVLSLMHPRGNPRTTALPFDEIYAKAIRSNTDKHWDDLDPASREKIKKQIFEAYEGINERVIKKANQPLLVAQGLTLHFA